MASAGQITTLEEYVRRIEARGPLRNRVRFFRGHSQPKHDMSPGLLRTSGTRKHEKNLLRELLSLQPSEFEKDIGVFEQLVRMQHFTLPTRLLDITSNPLVALYFCCRYSQKTDGELLRITVPSSHVRYYDSDTVSCVANLSNLSGAERDELRRIKTDAGLRSSKAGKRLLQFIKSEKPYFLPRISRADLDGPVVVKPRLTNRRLLAQQGAFLLFGLNGKIRDTQLEEISVLRLTVPSKAKAKLLQSLDRVGINDSTMFPEIESAARYVMSQIVPADTNESEEGE